METIVKVVCAVVLLMNIAVAIAVIFFVASSTHDTQTSNTEGLKQEISKIYTDRLTILNDNDNDTRTLKENLCPKQSKWYDSFSSTNCQACRGKTCHSRRPSTPAAFLNLLKPIAFITGLDFSGHTGTTDYDTPIKTWVPFVGPGRQLLYNGMTYEHGSITIPATGVYVVYSHVKFYTERNSRGDKETDFQHSIMRYNALEQTRKTALADTVSENKNDIIEGAFLEYSSDIHGILLLNAGDQLIVKVSKMKPLMHDRDWHYFGAYLI